MACPPSQSPLQSTNPPGSPKQAEFRPRIGVRGSKSVSEGWDADAIIVENPLLGLDDDDSEELAKQSLLHKAADEITLNNELDDKPVSGKRQGYHILEEIRSLRREVRISDDKDQKANALLENEVKRLRVEIESKELSEEGLKIRRRFLEVYKRDVLHEPANQKTINEGNETAHHGNTRVDAILYKIDQRSDHTIFIGLYGLTFQQVLNYYVDYLDGGVFSVLNAHATSIMQKKEMSEELEKAFKEFVMCAEAAYPSTPSDDPSSRLGQAYSKFWKLYDS